MAQTQHPDLPSVPEGAQLTEGQFVYTLSPSSATISHPPAKPRRQTPQTQTLRFYQRETARNQRARNHTVWTVQTGHPRHGVRRADVARIVLQYRESVTTTSEFTVSM